MAVKKRILVVDDDPLLRRSLPALLGTLLLGQEVVIHTARSGEEALQLLQQQPYQMVLMDTQMGGIDGYEACAQMKAQNQEQVVIGMSTDRSYRSAWIKAGAEDFIAKFDLVQSLDGILKQYFAKEE